MPNLLRFLLPLFTLVLYISCDTVERPDRWREDPQRIVPRRNVLLVDFTGQRCSNCPAASDLVRSLTAGAAGARIIPVAVHGGPLSLQSKSSPVGLANDDSRRLTDSAGVSSWPMGTVDRVGRGSLLRPAAWNTALADRLTLEADLPAQQSLTADAKVKLPERTLTYTLLPRHLTRPDGTPDPDTYLHLWLVEDSIAAPQILADGTEDARYLHRHVLRLNLTRDGAIRLPAPRAGSTAPAMARPQVATAQSLSDTPHPLAAASHPLRTVAATAAAPGSPEAVADALTGRIHGKITLPVGFGLSARFATTTRINFRRLTLIAFLTHGRSGEVRSAAASRVEVR